jgi:hypothetical protein
LSCTAEINAYFRHQVSNILDTAHAKALLLPSRSSTMSPRSVVSMVKKVGPEPNSESKCNRTVES